MAKPLDRAGGMTSLRPGFARIEFICIEDEAATLLQKGHTVKSAYDYLAEKKKLRMKYDTFRRYVHARLKKSLQAPPANHGIEPAALLESGSVHQTSVAIRNGPIRVASKNSQFDSNDFDVNELGPTRE